MTKKPIDNGRLYGGIALLGAGFLLLAANLGWLNGDVWDFLWRFWPLALIIIGLRYLVPNPKVFLPIAAVLVLGSVWLVTAAPEPIRSQVNGTSDREARTEQAFRQSLGNAEKLNLTLDFGAAHVTVRELEDSGQAYRAEFENATRVFEEVKRQNGQLEVKLEEKSGIRNFWRDLGDRRASLYLNTDVPVDFSLDSGASKHELDFSQVQLRQLTLDMGASSGDITFGNKADSLDATIDSGASSLKLRIPKDLGIKIIADTGLTSDNFETAGLTRNGETYQTDGFDSSAKKITIRLDAGASSIKLERY